MSVNDHIVSHFNTFQAPSDNTENSLNSSIVEISHYHINQ